MSRAPRALLALLLAGCAARGAVPPFAPEVRALAVELDSAFSGPEFARASWGVVVQSLDNGQVLYRRNAERLFMPASNMKIVTGAVALARLGPEFRFATTVLARGPRRGDTLAGDLAVIGRGDPTFSLHATGGADVLASLRPWADSLTAHGVRVIQGRVVGDGSAFPDAPLGPGWAWDYLDAAYAATVGALQFNEGFALIEVSPGQRTGDSARAQILPRSAPLRLFGAVSTAPADSNVSSMVWSRAPFTDSVTISGRLSAGRPAARLPVSVLEPRGYFEAALTQALTEAAITVSGSGVPPGMPAETLFVWRSMPLREILPLFEKPSQNQIGETLLRALGLEVMGVGSIDSGRAVVRETLTDFGVPPDAYVIADGSGLSRYNYVAPEALARVLAAVARRPDFPVFHDALPVAGVDGTIAQRLRGTAAEGNAHAKTGTIANVRSLSGYVRTADGERFVFVMIANHFTVPNRMAEVVQDHVVERLANFRRGTRRDR